MFESMEVSNVNSDYEINYHSVMISNANNRNFGECTDFLFDKCSVQNIVQIIAAHVIDISNIILGHSLLFPFLVSQLFFGMVKKSKTCLQCKIEPFHFAREFHFEYLP